jgi:mannan endo-1,4-beta-mannosidase
MIAGIVAGTLMFISGCPSEPESLGAVSFETEASPNKKRLLNYLSDEYGRRIISGQMDTSWTTNSSMDMVARVFNDTGKYPAIKGFDFIQLNYDGGNEQVNEALEWWNGKNNGKPLVADKHGIVAFCWHWKVGGNDFYTENTAFRIPYKDGKLDVSSSNFRLISADLDKLVIQLQRLKDADVPVLWRPLHEASGGWFWWGASGAAPYIALWEYIYDYLAIKNGLNNLIWVWNGQGAAWFPNAATVDIVGVDVYPGAKNYASQAGKFAETLNMVPARNRMVALSENGAIPDPDACENDNAMWSWFMTWNDGYGSTQGQTDANNFWTGEHHNAQSHKNKVYHHELVVTLDELPDLTEYGDGE